MIVLDGQNALSAFRLERLNRELAAIAPGTRVSAAWHVYFIEAAAEATLDRDRLREILRAAAGTPKPARWWIVPRLGTISPWSS